MTANKLKLVYVVLVLVLALPLMAAPPKDVRPVQQHAASYLSTTSWVNVNKLLMFATNYGNYAYDAGKYFGQNDGLYFPYSTIGDIESGLNANTVLFDAGIWIGAKDSASDSTLVTVAEYSTEYGPGPMVGGTYIVGADTNLIYRNYTLYSDSMYRNPGADYSDWPTDQGAPMESLWIDTTIGGVDTTVFKGMHPAITGDEMIWSVYNDANPTNHTNQAGRTNPMGVEIQQSTFSFKLTGPFANIAFVRFKVMNRGSRVLKDMYVSLWSDPDLGGAGDDLVGCDTTLSLGFCYNGTNNDADYGSTPPAVGFDFFQGPLDSTGNPGDTAIMWGKKWPGNRNLPMSSFPKYVNQMDPKSASQSYNLFEGLAVDGTPYTYGGRTTPFAASGDPVAGTGFLDNSPADRRMLLNTGPFTMRPGDSTEVIAAVIVGQGKDRLTSISALKYYDKYAQYAYSLNFKLPKPATSPAVHVANLDDEVSLTWNDTSEVDNGDYDFQGYTIYQSKSPNGPWIKIANYDINDGVGIIFDEEFDLDAGVVINKPLKFGSDNGIKRYFLSTIDAETGDKLSNVTQYYYKVEAYTYNASATPRTLTSETIVVATPQKPLAGIQLGGATGDSLPTIHVAGKSDGIVSPMLVDPASAKNDVYRLTFGIYPDTVIAHHDSVFDTTDVEYDTTTTICDIHYVGGVAHDTTWCVDTIYTVDTTADYIDTTITDMTYWKLYDVTDANKILDSQLNQEYDNLVKIFDGIQLKVSGPPAGLKAGEPGEANAGWAVTGGTRRFTQLNADGLGLEGFRATAGWWSPYYFFMNIHDVPAGELVNVELRLAETDSLGVFDPNDSNVSYGYRYGRGFANPPAKPEFAPYITNAVGGYSYQDFTKSVPLSAWDMETEPPTRLAVGFLENNAVGGMVDGRYWPPYYEDADNTDAAGPREWLFIYKTAYSETPNAAYEVTSNANPVDIMYGCTFARRDVLGWTPGDRFELFTNHVNLPADTFTFSAMAPTLAKSEGALSAIRAVPNPYYLFSGYDTDVYRRQIRFTNLPQVCTISLYNLAGDKVAEVKKNSTESWAIWNVQTSNNVPVASGIYLYVVDAPGYGQKVGKLAVFTETEQLKEY